MAQAYLDRINQLYRELYPLMTKEERAKCKKEWKNLDALKKILKDCMKKRGLL